MKTKDIVVGVVVLAVFITGILAFNKYKKNTPKVSGPTPNYQQVESKFPSLKVPDNADKINLNNVSGGSGIGEAFRTFKNGKFNLTVIANLPAGSYKASLIDDKGAKISMGSLTSEKGGYIINFSINKDLTGYKRVVVSEGSKNILEGSF